MTVSQLLYISPTPAGWYGGNPFESPQDGRMNSGVKRSLLYRLHDYLLPPHRALVPIRSQTKIQTIWTWSPEEESLLDIPFKLHAIFNSGSVQFVSLVPPQGHQVVHTCAVAVSTFFWLNTFSQRIWRGRGMRKWMVTVTVWKVHPASHDSVIVLLKITHSSASRVRDVRCDPGVPAWSCVRSLLLQLHRRIYSTLPSPSIAFPCPAPDLAHSFSSSGKAREQRRQKHGNVGARAVICERFFGQTTET